MGLEKNLSSILNSFNFSTPVRLAVREMRCMGAHNYSKKSKFSEIVINPTLLRPERTLYHETGHHIYMFELTSAEREDWSGLYATSMEHVKNWRNYFVSRSAMKHENEDFACTFSAMHYELDVIWAEKKEFMLKLLNRLKKHSC